MKKLLLLPLTLMIAFTSSFAQKIIKEYNHSLVVERSAVVNSENASMGETNFYQKNRFNDKAFGDTLYYEDFDGGIPTGWSVINNQPNNYDWKWDTIYQQGDFTDSSASMPTGITAIKSTTAANGFMSLPSDYYNSPLSAGVEKMDTYFESKTITHPTANFSKSVWISYQQYLRYCCNESNKLVLQVSTDTFNTIYEFDATDQQFLNIANASNSVGVQTNTINIGCAVAGANDFKIRFLSEGNTHYFWMIDDLAIIEGPINDLALKSTYLEFNATNYNSNPFYGQIPYCFFPNLSFSGKIKNNGLVTQTNVELAVDVNHLNTLGGGPATGQGNLYSIAELAPNAGTVAVTSCDSVVQILTGTPGFSPRVLGDFEVEFEIISDSIDQILSNGIATKNFSVTDTIFARDDGEFTTGSGTGPSSYVDSTSGVPGGIVVGDRFATLYTLESISGHSSANIPTSITFAVSGDSRNIGVKILPKIWEFDEDSLLINGTNFNVNRAFGNEVASSFLTYTVKASDTNSFITLPLTSGTALVGNGLDSGQYAVGWEVDSLPLGSSFSVANDLSTAALQPEASTFVYFGHSTNEGWGAVSSNPVIRLNVANAATYYCYSLGMKENTSSDTRVVVSPNPTKNLTSISAGATIKNILIFNSLGQKVNEIQAIKDTNYQLSLEGPSGIYFVQVHLTNGEVKTAKVVKQ